MKLLVESLMIFFGTLIAAAVVALGEPVDAPAPQSPSPSAQSVAGHSPLAQQAGPPHAGPLAGLR